ncbi:hypothetical protein DFP72DRAFT_894365 [Ephemerocybe angulata]|uniref:Secreted protein n=1 Tax=Ephemerocybe angulata TaxID=980116 RepID=A0A8H6M5H3_9AGAR|nr:hypothetical protein DFP72DRAFT_894365 [Tulosesus angulatus]
MSICCLGLLLPMIAAAGFRYVVSACWSRFHFHRCFLPSGSILGTQGNHFWRVTIPIIRSTTHALSDAQNPFNIVTTRQRKPGPPSCRHRLAICFAATAPSSQAELREHWNRRSRLITCIFSHRSPSTVRSQDDCRRFSTSPSPEACSNRSSLYMLF